MAAYPNIKVEIVDIDPSTYNEGLMNLASEQKLPDVFWAPNVCDAINNGWALRLDDYYANDPDATFTESILKYAQVDGRRYSVPAKSRPTMMVINKSIFDLYNTELPDPDWTFEDFVQVVENIAHPEDGYYGYGFNTTSDFFMPRYGWDGDSYTFDETWVYFEETMVSLVSRRIAENADLAERLGALGDDEDDFSGFVTGHAAMNVVSYDSGGQGYIDGSVADGLGCEFVIYPVPSPINLHPDDMWFACISMGTQHPNEAWELAKWMTWGKEATICRNTWFQENEIAHNMLPFITDEEVWADTKAKAHPSTVTFYEHVKDPYPSIDTHAPNIIMCNVMYFFGSVPNSFYRGERQPADYASTLRTQYNGYRDEWYKGCSEFGAVPERLVTVATPPTLPLPTPLPLTQSKSGSTALPVSGGAFFMMIFRLMINDPGLFFR